MAERECRRIAPAIAVGAVLAVAFAAMPVWHGLPRAHFESYAITATAFEAKLDGMVSRYQVGEDDGLPLVRPPGGDVYVTAERWRFRPVLELQAGQTYRVHVSSADTLHGVVIAGREALLVPGQAAVLTVTPADPGRITIVCSEYCGLDHNKMRNWITVLGGP